jgi:hypothetical protein
MGDSPKRFRRSLPVKARIETRVANVDLPLALCVCIDKEAFQMGSADF